MGDHAERLARAARRREQDHLRYARRRQANLAVVDEIVRRMESVASFRGGDADAAELRALLARGRGRELGAVVEILVAWTEDLLAACDLVDHSDAELETEAPDEHA